MPIFRIEGLNFMADDKELIDLEFDQDDYLPNSVLVEAQISEPLEVSFEFETKVEESSKVAPEKIQIAQPISEKLIPKVELKPETIIDIEIEKKPEQAIKNQGELNTVGEVEASFTEIIEEVTNLQNEVADFILEVTSSTEVIAADHVNQGREEIQSNQLNLDQSISEELSVTKLLETEKEIEVRDTEQDQNLEDLDDDQFDFREIETKPKKFPIELLIYIALGSLALFLINYFLFVSHSEPNVEKRPKLNNIIHDIANKHVEEEKENNKKIKLDLIKDIEGKNYHGHVRLHLENDIVKSFDLKIIGDEPPQLTPEEIVAKNKRLPWIQRIEINNLSLVSSKTGDFAGSGKARVYIDDEEIKKRVLVELSVKGDYRLAQKSAEIEVTIQEGASHLNLNEISNQSYKDNLWIKNYNDGYDLLFNTKVVLKKK
jgi:hypothetical protein